MKLVHMPIHVGHDHYYNCAVFVVCSLIFVAGVAGKLYRHIPSIYEKGIQE